VALPVQVLQKQGHHTRKRTLPVIAPMGMTTGIDFERLDDSTGTVIFQIAIPVLTSDVPMTIPEMTSYVAMTVPVL
jgi:hypothetical protein